MTTETKAKLQPTDVRATERQRELQRDGPGLLQVFTLVVWIVWLAIGLLGWWLSAPPPAAPAPLPPKPPPPVQAELLDVELADQPLAAENPSPDQPAPIPQMAAPPLPSVAAFTPAIPFAVPIEGAVRIVNAAQANPARIPLHQQPIVRRLTNAAAERLPKPEYPAEARILGQQGTVGVRFTVGEDGSVTSAQVIAPSFASLNQAALETVRAEWHFGPGPHRIFDYYFVFRLNQT